MYDVSKLPRRSNSNFCGPERTFQIPGFKHQDKAGQPIHKTGWNNSRTILSLGAVYILLGLGQSTKRLNQVKSHTILAMEMAVAVQAKDASKQQKAKSQKQTAKSQKPKAKTQYKVFELRRAATPLPVCPEFPSRNQVENLKTKNKTNRDTTPRTNASQQKYQEETTTRLQKWK
ncbi:hypothetical protein CLU79DRAFT_714786 [Phycomyces nitens]|nr:hypothetical protein CLU79DRAFT_714786 [Phycomyces nitens]